MNSTITAISNTFDEIIFFFEYLMRIIKKLPKVLYQKDEIIKHMSELGVHSLPIIVFATTFAGIVVTSEMAFHMKLVLGTAEMIPGVTGQFIFRELGIAIPALLMVAKAGASITAEVSTMKITEQIDALKLLEIDPYEYIVIPRLIACTIVVSCLTIIAIFVTLFFAVLFAVLEQHFTVMEYINAMTPFLYSKDLFCALTKGAVFGSVIPLIACFYGFQSKAGAEGVGHSTTSAVVTSTLVIIVLDFLLSFIFSFII